MSVIEEKKKKKIISELNSSSLQWLTEVEIEMNRWHCIVLFWFNFDVHYSQEKDNFFKKKLIIALMQV